MSPWLWAIPELRLQRGLERLPPDVPSFLPFPVGSEFARFSSASGLRVEACFGELSTFFCKASLHSFTQRVRVAAGEALSGSIPLFGNHRLARAGHHLPDCFPVLGRFPPPPLPSFKLGFSSLFRLNASPRFSPATLPSFPTFSDEPLSPVFSALEHLHLSCRVPLTIGLSWLQAGVSEEHLKKVFVLIVESRLGGIFITFISVYSFMDRQKGV